MSKKSKKKVETKTESDMERVKQQPPTPQPELSEEKPSRRNLMIGASGGLFILMVIVLLVVAFVTGTWSEEEPMEKREAPASAEEILLDSTLSEAEFALNEIDVNGDLGDFDDEELSISDTEDAFDESLEEIDTLIDDLQNLEDQLVDFSEDDF